MRDDPSVEASSTATISKSFSDWDNTLSKQAGRYFSTLYTGITTDEKSCEEIKSKLSNIELKNTKVLPFYLAKGLEFEGVILYDKTSYLKNNKNIFYVSATRAREMLIIYN